MSQDVTGGAVAALAFGAVARARDDRALHPDGVVFGGAVTGPLFGARRALVRVSRGGGLPETLPDVRGCAIRVLGAHGSGRHQDLLLASSLAAPVGRHLLIPGREFGECFYSSLLPYRLAGRRVLFGAEFGEAMGKTLPEVARAVQRRSARLRLLAASPLGAWEEVGCVTLDEVVPHACTMRFSPWVTGGDIEPEGWLMRLRDPAYRASQAAAADSAGRSQEVEQPAEQVVTG